MNKSGINKDLLIKIKDFDNNSYFFLSFSGRPSHTKRKSSPDQTDI